MLAVASAIVVVAFPLVLSRTPHAAAWWGGILLMVSMLAFIVAFLVAGFITVSYNAPPPNCSSLRCTEGGIQCNHRLGGSTDDNGDLLYAYFQMDPNMASLNTISNASSAAECITYNRSISYGNYSTLFPWIPDGDYSNVEVTGPKAAAAIQRLLQDPLVQAETVCADQANLPQAIDPEANPETFEVNVTYDIPDLAEFLVNSGTDVYNLLSNASFTELMPYDGLNYVCLSNETAEAMSFNVLCDQSNSSANLSVSKAGDYISAMNAADSSAVLFDVEITAQQVSKAIKALAGVFAFILLVIVVFLLKSKFF